MERQPLISIIVPVYNQRDNIERCLNSIRYQTYKNIEVLIIDDGSTDSSNSICDNFEELDSRIRVFHISNSGVSNARNIGLDNCKGSYVAFVDSDDYVHEKYIEILYSSIIELDVKAIWCGYQCVNSSDTSNNVDSNMKRIIDAYRNYDYGSQYILRHCCTALFQKEVACSFHFSTDLVVGEDAYYVAQIIKKIRYFGYIDRKLYYYVQNNLSVMHSEFTRKRATAIEAWKRIIALYKDVDQEKLVNGCLESLALVYKDGIINLCNQERTDKALFYEVRNGARKIDYDIFNWTKRQKMSYFFCCYMPMIVLRIMCKKIVRKYEKCQLK